MPGRFLACTLGLVLASAALGQQASPPLLRLEAGGPTSATTALAFSPGGETLYAAGFDKVVRVWGRNAKTGLFELDEKRSYRVPVNPGTQGVINSIALSDDGKWLAVGGLGVVRETAGFFVNVGRMWPTIGLTPEQWSDQGVIHVFSTQDQGVRLLRGHHGPVVSLAFAPTSAGKPATLVSAADGMNGKQFSGEVLAWDVAAGKVLVELRDLPAYLGRGMRPGLAAAHVGVKAEMLRVAIAWGDGNHRFVDADIAVKEVKEGLYNTAIALSPDGRTLLTGSFNNRKGELQEWDFAGDPKVSRRIDLAAPAGTFHVPALLSLVGAAGQAPGHAAVVLRHLPKPKTEIYRLHLVDLASGKTQAQVELWPHNPMKPAAPALASSSRGGYLAVARNDDQTIQVYAFADLIQGNAKPQVLHSAGESMGFVAFAKDKKDRLGLALGTSSRPQDRLIFDFGQRILTDNAAGWTLTKPQAAEGSLSIFVPAQDGGNPSLRAEATYEVEKGLVKFDLYDTKTGTHFRRFTGHTAPIASVAVSPDGKLLATSAHDQTISVWSLTDVPEILGRHGRLAGVAAEMRGNTLEIAKVDKDSSAQGQLAEGNVVEGMLVDGELKPFASAFQFYEAFWMTRPGDKVTLRIADGAKKRNLTLAADQGIDERKPLFSLFVTRPAADGSRDWLGWNAQGPFDAGSPAAERLLGWHINPAQDKEAARFAAIQQYRKEFYKKDVLKFLVAEGSLAKALEKLDAPPPPKPIPQFSDALGVEKAPNGDILLRQPKAQLRVAIRDFTPAPDAVVEWRLDDGEPQVLAAPEGNLWTLPLDLKAAQGQLHQVRLSVRFQEEGKKPVQYDKDLRVRYQPPAPKLTHDKAGAYASTDQLAYTFKGTLEVKGVGPSVRVELFLNEDKTPVESWDVPRDATGKDVTKELSKALQLKEGKNLIVAVAQNKPSLKDFEDAERDTLSVQVMVKPNAPTIALQRIVPLDGDESPVTYQPGKQVVFQSPRVRIEGTIKAQTKLTVAEADLGAKTAREKLTLKAGDKGDIAFTHEVALQPGSQTVRFFARTAASAEGTDTAELFYRPQLPRVVLKAPGLTSTTVGETTVAGLLLSPAVPSPTAFPLEVVLSVNGKKVETIKLNSGDTELPARKITLQPGNNQVKVEVTHAWGGSAAGDGFSVRYIRPPQITKVALKPIDKQPFADVTAEVVSPDQPLVDSVKVMVNGQRQTFARAAVRKGPAASAWIIDVKEVPLGVNKNEITLTVANEDAESAPSKAVEVVYMEPLVAPQISLVSPTSSEIRLSEPELPLSFQVRSKSPLKRVEVILENHGRKVLFRGENLEKLVAKQANVYEFSTKTLALEWNLNRLKIEAVNDGGVASETLVVSVPVSPVEVSIESLKAAGGNAILPKVHADGTRTFPAVGDGKVILEGKVRWSSRDDHHVKRAQSVRVFVNGYQQVPVALKPALPGKRERTFKAEVDLTLPENHLEVDLPELVQVTTHRTECTVACQNPTKRSQHLHMVLVAPGMKNGKELQKRMAVALKAKNIEPNLYQSDVFDRVYVHVLAGHVTAVDISSRMHEIQADLRERAGQGSGNDVVMFYFLGKDAMTYQQGWSLLTSGEDPEQALAMKDMKLTLTNCTGAQALFLDLRSTKSPAVDRERFALFRFMQDGSKISPELLNGLEKGIPQATWLEQLPPILEKSLQPQHFVAYHPPALKVRLNPETPR